ncbi:MAG: mannonate dehydratase [Bryobacterales bacterium]|nr:mannonate dehydratase [Bryobacterales bacterium]
MKLDRRHFVRMGAATAMGGLLALAAQEKRVAGIKLGTSFTPAPKENDFEMLRYSGVEAVSIWTTIENNNLEWMLATRKKLEANHVEVYNIGILDLHCDPTIVLGLDGVDNKIAQYKAYLGNLSRAGIHYTTYAHMANIKIQKVPGYYQTSIQTARGGAPTREFDLAVARTLPFSHGKEYHADHIWGTFTKFIRAVMPVAEKNKVRIGLHPDDPPVDTLGGVARVFRNIEGYDRAFQIAGSENFGACLCIGTWAEGGKMMGLSPVEAVHYFGKKKKLFKVHFRNVTSPLPKFREAFLDDGYVDMYGVMRALKQENLTGIIIPDHVPGGGYPAANLVYTIGYMKALRDRANREVA